MSHRIAWNVIFISMFLAAGMLSCHLSHPSNRVLLIPRVGSVPQTDFMLTMELGVMKQMLEKEGFEVTVATPSGEPIVGKTKRLQPDRKLTEINLDEYLGVILPCMAVLNADTMIPEVVDIVKKAFSQGKPIAAQFGAVATLAKAGVLAGKKYAFFSEPPKYAEGFKDGTYAGKGVVQDGIIITSGVCPLMAKSGAVPDGTPKLTEMFIAELKRHR